MRIVNYRSPFLLFGSMETKLSWAARSSRPARRSAQRSEVVCLAWEQGRKKRKEAGGLQIVMWWFVTSGRTVHLQRWWYEFIEIHWLLKNVRNAVFPEVYGAVLCFYCSNHPSSSFRRAQTHPKEKASWLVISMLAKLLWMPFAPRLARVVWISWSWIRMVGHSWTSNKKKLI